MLNSPATPPPSPSHPRKPSIRSMTGFAQAKAAGEPGFTLSLKSVNHRYLDLHLRMPPELDLLEGKLRNLIKSRVARGHIDLYLTFDGAPSDSMTLNRSLVESYVAAIRSVGAELDLKTEPDLNTILQLPGAFLAARPALSSQALENGLEKSLRATLDQALMALEAMREEEGKELERDLRGHMALLHEATDQLAGLRAAVAQAYLEKLQSRMTELIGGHADQDRILQEAAIIAERSDVQEELVRMAAHIAQFLKLLDGGGEVGKKLDFLLQEMNREANTLLSKSSGIAGEGLRITELGLTMKAEIEKSREQVQNIE